MSYMKGLKVGDKLLCHRAPPYQNLSVGKTYTVISVDRAGDAKITDDDGKQCYATTEYLSVPPVVAPMAPGVNEVAAWIMANRDDWGSVFVAAALEALLRDVFKVKIVTETKVVPTE